MFVLQFSEPYMVDTVVEAIALELGDHCRSGEAVELSLTGHKMATVVPTNVLTWNEEVCLQQLEMRFCHMCPARSAGCCSHLDMWSMYKEMIQQGQGSQRRSTVADLRCHCKPI